MVEQIMIIYIKEYSTDIKNYKIKIVHTDWEICLQHFVKQNKRSKILFI